MFACWSPTVTENYDAYGSQQNGCIVAAALYQSLPRKTLKRQTTQRRIKQRNKKEIKTGGKPLYRVVTAGSQRQYDPTVAERDFLCSAFFFFSRQPFKKVIGMYRTTPSLQKTTMKNRHSVGIGKTFYCPHHRTNYSPSARSEKVARCL